MKLRKNTHMIIFLILIIALLLVTTVYAAINSITGDIKGKAIADKQTGVYITDVQYVSDIDADLGASTIKNFKGTFMQNTVQLSSTNSASEIKYKVTVYNSSDKSYPFLAVLYDEQFYDNPNIIFEISEEGYKIEDIINPLETKDIYITFKYKDGQIPSNTTLNANLNFKIAEPNRMMMASDGISSKPYLRGTITKNKIETIKFELGKIEPEGTISSFDASEKNDGSIMGYYTDENNDGLYDLTFASNELIFANTNASYLFMDLEKLKNIVFNNFSTFGVTNMSEMFEYCYQLTSLDVSKFNTSQVTDMSGMFAFCFELTSLDVSKFNTSQVTDMSDMFAFGQKLTSLEVSNFDTSQVTDMTNMFDFCSKLTSVDVSKFNTSKVTSMQYMFGDCSNLTNLELSNFNTSNVTDMRGMFSNCGTLTSLEVKKFDTSKVTDMRNMFNKCQNLTSLEVRNFDTSQVKDMSNMFKSCESLTSLEVSNFNTSQVTNMSDMFSSCYKLTTINASNFDTSKVTNMANMFANCYQLKTIYVSEFDSANNTGWTTSAVSNSTSMFTNSKQIVGGNGTKYSSSYLDKEYARIDKFGEPGYLTDIEVNRMMERFYSEASVPYLRGNITKEKIETIKFEWGKTEPQGTISSFDASEKEDGSIMGYYTDANNDELYDLTFISNELIYANKYANSLFRDLTNLKNIEFNNFSTLGVIDMYCMFYDCSSLTAIDISKFDTSKVIDMRHMFSGCENLISLDLNQFDTSRATDMSYMFWGCKNLTSLDLDNFDTSNVINMNSMFGNCMNLKSLDVSNYDTSQVTNMTSMFNFCRSLINLDVSKFNTSKVTRMSYMFSNCSSLISLDVSKFDTSQVTNMSDMFSNCSSLISLDVSKFDTSQVTDMSKMFSSCDSLTSLDITKFDTSKIASMRFLFNNCKNITNLNLSEIDTSQVTDMTGMFYNCNGLTELDLSNFDTGKVNYMKEMFDGCTQLTTIYVSEFNPTTSKGWTTSSVTSSTDMFYSATKLVGGNGTKFSYSHVDKEYARIDKPGEPGYFTDIKDKPVSPSEIFDKDGIDPNKLHIGDFVNYDAGTWTQTEINAIKTGEKTNLVTANGSTALPNQQFQFGGFTAGSSRNGNATHNTVYGQYNYVKDKSTGKALTGWRVYDVEGDRVTLISAGNSEDYYHHFGTNYAYMSEYILTGNINSSWASGGTESGKYQKRDWSKYVNSSQRAESARPLTKSRLDNWYTKYTNTPNADTLNEPTFQKIYKEPYIKYQNMIENYSYFWLSAAFGGNGMYVVDLNGRYVGGNGYEAFGIRLLVTLSSEVKLTSEKIGTKTVTGGNTTTYGGDQTYNVWGIK